MHIATRIFLYLFSLIAVSSAVLGYVSIQDERDHLLSGVRSEARLMARSLAAVLRFYHPGDPAVDLDRLLAEISPRNWETPPMLRFYDRAGAPIGIACALCNPLPLPMRRIDLATLDDAGREDFFERGLEQFFSIVVPVRGAGELQQGALEVVLPLKQINQVLASTTRRFLFFTVTLTVGLGVVVILIARWNITQPMQQLIKAARMLGSGNFSQRIESSGVIDLDHLIDELNRMANQLEELDSNREKFYQEKLQLEKGLRHTEKLASIGQLSSGLAHEIGTPLNVITGRAEQLLSRTGVSTPGRKELETILRQSEQITLLIDRLLSFSRQDIRCWDEVILADLIHESMNLCRMRFPRDDFAVELELKLDVASLTGDINALRQLFVNLMLNSIQAMNGKGLIRISSLQRGDRLEINFEDNGPGIPEEHFEKVFDPFFTSKDVGEGTGLGLFIVANIIEEHEGEIQVTEGGIGGVRFIITFPLTLAAQTLTLERNSGKREGIPDE